MLQAGRSRVPFPIRSLHFFSLTNRSSGIMTLGWTQPLKNEYQESSREFKCNQRVWLTTSSPSVSQLPRKFAILDVSQPYGPRRPVMEIAFFTCFLFLCN
jgi:hypothetical protein